MSHDRPVGCADKNGLLAAATTIFCKSVDTRYHPRLSFHGYIAACSRALAVWKYGSGCSQSIIFPISHPLGLNNALAMQAFFVSRLPIGAISAFLVLFGNSAVAAARVTFLLWRAVVGHADGFRGPSPTLLGRSLATPSCSSSIEKRCFCCFGMCFIHIIGIRYLC